MRDRTDHTLFCHLQSSPVLARCPAAVLSNQIHALWWIQAFGTRNDLLSSAGLALYWTVCRNCDVRAFVDYNARFSNNKSASEYRQFDGGLGLNVIFRF